jgi:hypothetical protein
MSLQTLFLALMVVLYGAAQYALMAQALRDLARRTRVRGDNKVLWGIVILTLPIAGALLYSWMGPTSLRRRGDTPASSAPVRRMPVASGPNPKVTSIRAARDRRERAEATSYHHRVAHPSHGHTTTRPRPVMRRYDDRDAGADQLPRTPRTGS